MTAAARKFRPDPGASAPSGQDGNHVARFRPNELQRLREERYGKVITQDDDGLSLIEATLDSFALSAGPEQRMTNFLVLHCPWMCPENREEAIERAIRAKKFWTPSSLGDALKLTPEERQKLSIRTFRAAGIGDEEMAAMRRERNTARRRAKRDQERLHPKPKQRRPALRLEAMLKILVEPRDWVSVKAICAEVKRRKVIHFATLTGPNLTAAVHDAVKLGLEKGVIEKRFVEGPKVKVAEICRREGA